MLVHARRSTVVAVLLLVTISAACSSTENGSAGRTRTGSSDPTVAAASGDTSTTTAVGSSTAGDALTSPATKRGTANAPAASGDLAGPITLPGESGRASIGPASGPGFTAKEIKIGFFIPDPAAFNTVYKALGLQGLSDPDNRIATRALAAYVNLHGGIAGRSVVPVLRLDDANGSWSASQQEACSAFTEDTRVFAVITVVTAPQSDVLANCLAAKGVPFIFNNRILWDSAFMNRWASTIYAPSYLGGERWGQVIEAFKAGGFLRSGAKVGVMWQDTGSTKRTVNDVIKPAVVATGARVVADGSYPAPNSTGELGGAASQISSMVLRFRAAQVTHVLFVGTSGEGPLFFTPEAQAQGYQPRYGFTSLEIPQIIAKNFSGPQLHGAAGVGWWPTIDVDFAQDPKDNPAADLCLDIVRKAGGKLDDRWAASQVTKPCDGLFFLKTALDRVSTLTPAGMRRAVDQLGTTFRSAFTFSTRLSAGRLDGAASVRNFAYDDACGCFKYNAPPRAIR